MFIHNLKYTVKILFKNKVLIFWMFAFPIILGIFFHMAFENIEKDEALQVFDIAVIDNKEYQNQTIYQETFKELSDKKNKEPSAPGVTGTLLDASIMNGFETITRLGGYILLFSILSAFIRHYWSAGEMTEYLFLGALELTTGLHQLARSDLSPVFRYLCSMPMAAFGGVCILAQTKSLLHRDLSVLPYISAKCLNAAITAICALVFLKVV